MISLNACALWLPLMVLSTALLLVIAAVIGLVLVLLFVAALLPASLIVIFDGELHGFAGLRHVVRRLRSSVDDAATRLLGPPTSVPVVFLFRRLLPNSAAFRWLVVRVLGIYLYCVELAVGHLVAVVGVPIFVPTLQREHVQPGAIPSLVLFGFLVGYVFLLLAMVEWHITPHRKDDPARQDFVQDFGLLSDQLGDDYERDSAGAVVSHLTGASREFWSDMSSGKKAADEAAKHHTLTVRGALFRSYFISLTGFLVGLVSGLGLGPTIGPSSAANYLVIQRGVVFSFSYLVSGLAARVGKGALAVLGVVLLVGGVLLQALPYLH